MNVHDKYWWIFEHPELNKFGYGTVQIEIEPHMVCPRTKHTEKFQYLNTKLEYWVELLIPCNNSDYPDEIVPAHEHDWTLDCGGDSYEEAITNLYQKVLDKYGDYPYNVGTIGYGEDCTELDDFFNKLELNKDKNKEPEPLEDWEINYIKDDITHFKELISALEEYKNTAQNTEEVINDINDVKIALRKAEDSLALGYNVE